MQEHFVCAFWLRQLQLDSLDEQVFPWQVGSCYTQLASRQLHALVGGQGLGVSAQVGVDPGLELNEAAKLLIQIYLVKNLDNVWAAMNHGPISEYELLGQRFIRLGLLVRIFP